MHLISPSQVIRGNNAWLKGLPEILKLTKYPLVIGRSKATTRIRQTIINNLKEKDLIVYEENLQYDCCYRDLERIHQKALKYKCDGIIAAGGGESFGCWKTII